MVDITVHFDSKRHCYAVDFMVTVQRLKNCLHKDGLVPLSPENQCAHFQDNILSDEQHLHECGIRQGSEVYIHHKGDHHKDDHGADSGAVQTSEVGRQEGLSGSISEVPVSAVPEQQAILPTDVDLRLVDTATTEESELPLSTSTGGDTTGRTVINTEGVIAVYFNFQPRTLTVNFKATVRNLKDGLHCTSDEQQLHECVPIPVKSGNRNNQLGMEANETFGDWKRRLSHLSTTANLLTRLIQHLLKRNFPDLTIMQDILDDWDQLPSQALLFNNSENIFESGTSFFEAFFNAKRHFLSKNISIIFLFKYLEVVHFQNLNKSVFTQLPKTLITLITSEQFSDGHILSVPEIFDEAITQNTSNQQSTKFQFTTNKEHSNYYENTIGQNVNPTNQPREWE